ncbi:ankyrin-3-like [Leptopilina boulardi]|uniref:ankyrin-3-like n=1 Tax=Leptopilina boulardi TaxID=63433 RepID=UPI0021F56046|nr:ankyrin-3-like [Leptopilina boulardi]
MSNFDYNISDDDEEEEIIDERFVKFSKAIEEKNNYLISLLIKEEGILQKQFHSNCSTFLHIAAKCGTAENIKQLCELGANVNLPNKNGETAIFNAIKNDDIQLVKILIEHGANINITSKQGVTPLHLALLHGPEKTLRLIVKKIVLDAKNGNNLQDKKEEETMEVSEDEEYFDLSSDLEENLSFEEEEEEEESEEDSEEENLEGTMGMIKTILRNKKLFNIQKNDYPLLIFFAARIACGYILEVILRDCRKFLNSLSPAERKLERTKPRKANRDYFIEGGCNVRYIPQAPLDINFQGYFDRTALHYAVREEIPISVKFLLENGADPNAKTCEKLTPLHYAACLENYEICQILLNFDAYVNVNRCCQGNPLYHVCGQSTTKVLLKSTDGYFYDEFYHEYTDRVKKYTEVESTFNLKIMKLLLKNGANPNNRGENGASALHEACKMGRFKEVKLLLKCNAYLEDVDMDGNTALHHAAQGNCVKMIEFLLSNGLKIDFKGECRYTPLMMAIKDNEGKTSCLETIEYLVDHGADVNAKETLIDKSVLMIAIDFSSSSVVECLLELGAKFQTIFNVNEDDYKRYNLFRFKDNHKLLVCYIALREKDLGDYLQKFIKHNDVKVQEAFKFFHEAKNEVKKLKSMTILKQSGITYFDFLTQDFYTTVQHVKNGKLNQILIAGDYKKEFPCFNHFLESRQQRAKTLKKFVNKTFDFFTKNRKLPPDAVKMIFKSLDSKDFRIFGTALNKK